MVLAVHCTDHSGPWWVSYPPPGWRTCPALAVVVLGTELRVEADNLWELSADHSSEMELQSGAAALISLRLLLLSRFSRVRLCDPIDGNPPVSAVPGILQARSLEWVAIAFSNAWKWKVKVKSLSRVRLFTTPWTAAYQAPLSRGFSRQEYWSGLPLPSPLISLGLLESLNLLPSPNSIWSSHWANNWETRFWGKE